MTDLRFYVAIGLPIVAVLASLVVSLVQISGIREEMRTQNASIRAEIHEMRADMREIRVEMREIRNDIKILTGKVYEMMK